MTLAGGVLKGLSPRVRGNRVNNPETGGYVGSIPARAGEPVLDARYQSVLEVYPRACGGTPRERSAARHSAGLSPRVRGNPTGRTDVFVGLRSIPARAGEPPATPLGRHRARVYPRACGGTVIVDAVADPEQGLSPRVRGNRHPRQADGISSGSIPARAGEPRVARQPWRSYRVYPRACGGTSDVPRVSSWKGVYPRACGGTQRTVRVLSPQRGLSPRVRGNLAEHPKSLRAVGSIPARAGEPLRTCWHRRPARVYPRACGGTRVLDPAPTAVEGLSPRVRGNHVADGQRHDPAGSIPARAGEPLLLARPTAKRRVYPRACGGTASSPNRRTASAGLSPRVRGNPAPAVAVLLGNGSIPARAGEPRKRWRGTFPCRVYPRACGGTAIEKALHEVVAGLSPRVRGNRHHAGCGVRQSGSIPARAGEPCRAGGRIGAARVYPRACGGTGLTLAGSVRQAGLSPRVRGNHEEGQAHPADVGSIPARAGEPLAPFQARQHERVYPRACGGTFDSRGRRIENTGLSPRVRGNPLARPPPDVRQGSIPARAGEPLALSPVKGWDRVYPRACGGTAMGSARFSGYQGLSPRVRGNLSRGKVVVAWRRSIPARAGEPQPRKLAGCCFRVYPRACGGTPCI